MARPSLKIEKTEAILQAYERCIAQYGVDGATLQKVAQAANMARPLLRHYVGNQSDLLTQGLARFIQRQQEQLAWFDTVDTPTTLLSGLFSTAHASVAESHDVLIASAFTLAAPHYPHIHNEMRAWFAQFKLALESVLKRLYPTANHADIGAVGTGLTGIYFNVFAMQTIDSSFQFRQQSQQAAAILLNTLSIKSTI